MILPSLPSPEMVVPIVSIIETSNWFMCDVHQFGCGNNLVLARPTYGYGFLLNLQKMPVMKLLQFLIARMAVMVVGWALHHGSRQLVHVGIYWMEFWWGCLRCTHLNTLTPPAAPSFTGTTHALLKK